MREKNEACAYMYVRERVLLFDIDLEMAKDRQTKTTNWLQRTAYL